MDTNVKLLYSIRDIYEFMSCFSELIIYIAPTHKLIKEWKIGNLNKNNELLGLTYKYSQKQSNNTNRQTEQK